MERLLADYLGTCLGVQVKDVEVVVQDNGNGSVAVHLGLKTLQPLYGAPARYGSLVVRSVEHETVPRWEVGKSTPTQVPDGSVVNLSAVAGPETAEVFRLLAKQFEVTTAPAQDQFVADPAKPWLRTHTVDGQVVREDRRKPEMQANGAYVLRDPKTGVAYSASTGEELPGT